MTAISLLILAILAIILTVWLLVIPAEVIVASFRALREPRRRGARRR